jgi:hypothetical protein
MPGKPSKPFSSAASSATLRDAPPTIRAAFLYALTRKAFSPLISRRSATSLKMSATSLL